MDGDNVQCLTARWQQLLWPAVDVDDLQVARWSALEGPPGVHPSVTEQRIWARCAEVVARTEQDGLHLVGRQVRIAGPDQPTKTGHERTREAGPRRRLVGVIGEVGQREDSGARRRQVDQRATVREACELVSTVAGPHDHDVVVGVTV